MIPLQRAGLEAAVTGRTSLEEVYFKTSGDRRSATVESKLGGRRESDPGVAVTSAAG